MSLVNHFSRRLVSVTRATASFSKFNQARMFSYPSHVVVNMPSLSPTMETGSISKWNVKEGEKFEVGTSLCDVETDKATVSFDATEEGYIAKILINSGEIKVGEPLLVTVEEAADVAAFANFTVSSSAVAAPKPAAPAVAAPVAAAPAAAPVAAPVSAPVATGDRIFASPLAKKLIRESNNTLQSVHSVLKTGSGPNGRIIAADIPKALELLSKVGTSAPAVGGAAPVAAPVNSSPIFETSNVSYTDFSISDNAQELAASYVYSKQHVPHYYLSAEINLTDLLALREKFNAKLAKANAKNPNPPSLSVQDFLVKASAQAMKQVPDLNASWRDTFVRRYEEVDINLVLGSGANLTVPVLKNVNSLGLTQISSSLQELEAKYLGQEASPSAERFVPGTFTIHNLGSFGVKSASPVIVNGQAAALALGAIQDTVIPRMDAAEGEDNWQVAPIMVATLSCDHRVVDGAVAAQWLSAFKQLAENPLDLLL